MTTTLGYTMVGGLLLSQMLTLFTTPVIYLYLYRANVWLSKFWARNKIPETESATGPQNVKAK